MSVSGPKVSSRKGKLIFELSSKTKDVVCTGKIWGSSIQIPLILSYIPQYRMRKVHYSFSFANWVDFPSIPEVYYVFACTRFANFANWPNLPQKMKDLHCLVYPSEQIRQTKYTLKMTRLGYVTLSKLTHEYMRLLYNVLYCMVMKMSCPCCVQFVTVLFSTIIYEN